MDLKSLKRWISNLGTILGICQILTHEIQPKKNPDSSFSPLSRRSCQSPDCELDLHLHLKARSRSRSRSRSILVFSSLSVALLKLLQFLIGIQGFGDFDGFLANSNKECLSHLKGLLKL
ncbi:uncharacterized protein A4U43_C03F26900 [Asparagus officinalis]|uniref:Uncharacterized protein n=1 Tax=Asparagus officinalis TaxID=4686 RepID=A0A5P1FE22_ASPOF|nr:uncharacterized protein LOC109834453 [Asparagus officinalis]ONK76362.1 uncharacterized protein A4U43_C03F26900 [Asparagus officinalis]